MVADSLPKRSLDDMRCSVVPSYICPAVSIDLEVCRGRSGKIDFTFTPRLVDNILALFSRIINLDNALFKRSYAAISALTTAFGIKRSFFKNKIISLFGLAYLSHWCIAR